MRSSEGGLILNGPEVEALAWYVASRQLSHINQEDWLQREGLPMLAEDTFTMLCDAIQDISRLMLERMRWLEADHNIDARHLHEEASK